MSDINPAPSRIALSIPGRRDAGKTDAPAILRDASRGGEQSPDTSGSVAITVDAVYDLSGVSRGDSSEVSTDTDAHRLFALEAVDGTTLFIRADKLRDDLERIYPGAIREDGSLDLSVLRDPSAASRGVLDWAWSKLTVFGIQPDTIVDAARDKAKEWLYDRIGDQLGEQLEDYSGFSVSTIGAKALMWAIESKLTGEPGLYRWHKGTLDPSDRVHDAPAALAADAAAGPMLIFIHGTASHTAGSFKDLRSPAASQDWEAISGRFGNRVFGFEHRTFSESPIDNALALARSLPPGARLSLVTHSRGGLVGDLMCIGDLSDELVAAYERPTPPTSTGLNDATLQDLHRQWVDEEQAKLRELRRLLAEKDFRIEHYVRVACPAAGTTLLSDNVEIFLSGLLSLMSTLGGMVGGPVAGNVLAALKRIVLEIADKRLDPSLVPGIEAMLTDAPMGTLLANAPRKQGIAMAVISGDAAGDSFLKRLGLLFTDWMFFDRRDNDLVVDTRSMYAGLARHEGAYYLFDQGGAVNHFNYFENRRTRQALRGWLTTEDHTAGNAFTPLQTQRARLLDEATTRAPSTATRGQALPADTRPVVILLPGIMGTHLELRRDNQAPGLGNRVWFDPLHLMWGGLGDIRVSRGTSAQRKRDVHPEALFQMFYGNIIQHLSNDNLVIPFPYDWRLPIQDSADLLQSVVDAYLEEHPNQPVRLLAHSMGGLVARAMVARHPATWKRLTARPGGRLVMLGTPNNGSHELVASLLGKAGNVRKLARLDLTRPIQEMLEIIADFPGAVQLLPRPGFVDSGQQQATDYLDGDTWQQLAAINHDRWFGDHVAAPPTPAAVAAAEALWNRILGRLDDDGVWRESRIEPTDRVCYVYGQADNTACGIDSDGGQLKLLGTPNGDGSVTWSSGALSFLPDEQCWLMPVAHGDLADTRDHFDAVAELLIAGNTERLGRLPQTRGERKPRSYDAGPVPYPGEEELLRSLLNSQPRPLVAARSRRQLAIRVHAMDLRNAQVPVMCGHYIGDPIAGAERHIDRHLVDGALRQHELLGLYPGDVGTSAVVLMPRSAEEIRRRTSRGALIVGLGEMGRLTVGKVTETVKAGVLRYLLSLHDRNQSPPGETEHAAGGGIRMGSLLIGYNSTTLGSVESYIDAIINGVCEANLQFVNATQAEHGVTELEFIEFYLDTAISAAHAVRNSGSRLATMLQRLDTELDVRQQLLIGRGMAPRLHASDTFGYWPRLIVTDADRTESGCDPSCYSIRKVSPIPDEVIRELLGSQAESAGKRPTPDTGQTADATLSSAISNRLKYTFLGARARAEETIRQRQPGLIERLVEQAIANDRYDADLSRTLFQLMVPPEFKATARDLDRLALVLDGYTANLPWEMLQADDKPLILGTAVVRQFASARFRKNVQTTSASNACVIADPSTKGYGEHFPSAMTDELPRLDGAAAEGGAVRDLLRNHGYQVTFVQPGSPALDVITGLFRSQYRILMVAAHGVFQERGKGGTPRTGVVLSDGALLTAAEVGQLEAVPEVAFLNCCHLGMVNNEPTLPSDVNRLAYSLARELIEIGVRCVVVAGWAVDDRAARTFSEAFFSELLGGARFGDAVHRARRTVFDQHPTTNTWGAYQAYGDPTFVLHQSDRRVKQQATPPVAVPELLDELARLRDSIAYREIATLEQASDAIRGLLGNAPPEWARLPEIQTAVGICYSQFSPDGFGPARRAFEQAIAVDDSRGSVPIKAIEQLANLEARAALDISQPGNEESRRELSGLIETHALPLVDQAIGRLTQLIDLTGGSVSNPSKTRDGNLPVMTNAERFALLGNAYKVRARLMTEMRQANGRRLRWSLIADQLDQARQAYALGQGTTEANDFNPYAMLNRLHLDSVLGVDGDITAFSEDAKACQRAARSRFAAGYGFWDAVMAADAELAIALGLDDVTKPETQRALVASYRDAIQCVSKSEREIDSVLTQFDFLAAFLEHHGRDDRERAEALRRVAAAIAGFDQEPSSRDRRGLLAMDD